MKLPRLHLVLFALVSLAVRGADMPPNIIFIFCDNLGNGDVQCFNPSARNRTPNLDRMASEGRKFTSCYSASGVCTPSRAALMTGCYPRRLNLHISDKGGPVLQPIAGKGLHPDERTIAELLKPAGYATVCIGKWHLGDQPEFLPTRQGFDHYFGIPYSDDMTRDKHPEDWPDLPLMRDETVIEAPVDRDALTKRYTEEAVRYIEAHASSPFFLYLPHAMPGSTNDPFASPAFKGKSANGHYGDSIEELDWSTGEILAAVERAGIDERTLVVWTSDNGAVQRNPPQGSNAPYIGPGYSTSEGGMRMPCIMRWPGRIPAGTECRDIITMMDFLPTFGALANATPSGRTIDGRDASGLIFGKQNAVSAYDERGFFYYQRDQLQAVRAGRWKLYLPLQNKAALGKAKPQPQELKLADVLDDYLNETDAAAAHPNVVKRLLALAEQARNELGDTDRIGSGQRAAGLSAHPRPQVLPGSPK